LGTLAPTAGGYWRSLRGSPGRQRQVWPHLCDVLYSKRMAGSPLAAVEFPPMSSTPEAPTFGQEHFGQAYLGDKRRTRCLIDLADRFARHPGGTLPQKLKDPLALRRCYDLMKVPAVTHQSVLTPHRQCTLGLVLAQTGVVLEVHDGSELNFSQLTSLRDQLGQVGNGSGKGYQCLNSLAVLPKEGRVLGLV